MAVDVIFDKDINYSIDGVTVRRAKSGETHHLLPDLAESLVAAGFAHFPRKKRAKLETPETPADQIG